MSATATERPLLLSGGIDSEEVRAYRELVAERVRSVAPLVPDAEESGRFPRAAIEAIGGEGLARERWTGGPHGDAGKGVVISEELGRAGLGGVGVGVSVHLDVVLAALTRFGKSDLLRQRTEAALDCTEIGCFAATEDGEGSDLLGMRTTATRTDAGWHVKGTKAFASLGAVADFALVLCRSGDGSAAAERSAGSAIGPPLSVVCVPSDGFRVVRRLKPLGMRGLETVRIEIDAEVPDEAVLGREGRGFLITTWALTHERLASVAQLIGGADLGLSLATTRLHRRRQFGTPLIEHQTLRLRLAEIAAQATTGRLALYALAASLDRLRPEWAREVAALKVTLARIAERASSECLNMFGGLGYLEDATPLARFFRDGRFARLGGGTDEIMLELVAAGLPVNDELYDAHVQEMA
ncbi:MAG TPA: acyl-CoA dehydrogenase family protein [Thermoleophilaceae bacterium]